MPSAPYVCPTSCDSDCDAACHEGHQTPAKRGHDVSECIAKTLVYRPNPLIDDGHRIVVSVSDGVLSVNLVCPHMGRDWTAVRWVERPPCHRATEEDGSPALDGPTSDGDFCLLRENVEDERLANDGTVLSEQRVSYRWESHGATVAVWPADAAAPGPHEVLSVFPTITYRCPYAADVQTAVIVSQGELYCDVCSHDLCNDAIAFIRKASAESAKGDST